ncbi:damage-control phosphatase ARMT1 family protein [Streptomyces sp. SP18CS02]|uniref:damage-control phosphatase ARMT1 family protein n=1 Tax=Streptomyces sp. SP18CS02 TaxID=3002531 RepID=UPI002E790890|nr:damage-control phosphatase ARMT1 family protein [Streptomyces sp. SP18CS02]MEE1752323.1 damage-control phosphatase ARMT1 family protein [Streptomyces sp. SP18CS02]
MTASDEAPVIRSNEPGSFARSVLAERHPALIRQVRDAFPWDPARQRALDALLQETTDGVIEPLAPDAHDRDQWENWAREYLGASWFDVPFLWAESYFYRKLLAALGHFDPGPWQGVDPFAPFKRAELRSAAVDDELAALDELPGRPAEESAQALLHASLWGNRADLGFRISAGTAHTAATGSPPLVADDSALLWSLLPTGAAATVHLIADNAGRELIPDLVLLDHLLHTGRAAEAVLHIKPYPYYVSDATMPDVLDGLRRLCDAPGYAAGVGGRLWSAMTAGRLAVRVHGFFCAPLPYSAMPDDLRQDLAGATVTLVKGDLNYRRLVGDRLWPATTPFADRTRDFPSPVAALRTLKSDVIVGLDPSTLTALQAGEDGWRTNGTHALIQVRP